MDPALLIVAVVGAIGLSALWAVHLRAHLDRTGARASEWSGADGDDDELWTSSARCLRCHTTPVLLSRDRGELFHECMACGHREPRQHFG